MRLPPPWLRRLVLAPAVLIAGIALLLTAPLWLLIALALGSLVHRRRRPSRARAQPRALAGDRRLLAA